MASQLPHNGYLLGLDVGSKRIGAAVASVIAQLPQPLEVIAAGDSAIAQVESLVRKENVTMIVVGIPRNLDGQETAQSQTIRNFASELAKIVSVPVEFADESLSSVRAHEVAKQPNFKNTSQDSIAACFILEEFLNGNR